VTKDNKSTLGVDRENNRCEWSLILVMGILNSAAGMGPHNFLALQNYDAQQVTMGAFLLL
jgi:hypothetical protein